MSGTPSVSLSVSQADFSLLCEVIRQVARHGGLPADDAEDFSQHVHLRLLEKNYAPLAMFAGQSSFRTYLTVVVKRLLLDWRNARFGKWRPSAVAQRLGPVAVELDRLMTRDGHERHQAVAMLEARPSSPGADQLHAIAVQLPARTKVRVIATDDLEPLSVGGFADPVEEEQSAAEKRQLLRALRRACRSLPEADRRLLHLRFEKRLSVAAIADFLGEPAKPLYRQLERIVKTLRRSLQDAGTVEAVDMRHPGRASFIETTAIH